MATLRLRASAVGDLRGILEYSAGEYGIERATAYMADIDRAFARLREFPEIGERRFELGDDLRSFPVGEHRLYYRFSAGHVSVVRVLHKARDAKRWLH